MNRKRIHDVFDINISTSSSSENAGHQYDYNEIENAENTENTEINSTLNSLSVDSLNNDSRPLSRGVSNLTVPSSIFLLSLLNFRM